MKMKHRIEELDKMITFWQDIVDRYPLSEQYKIRLQSMKDERCKIASSIGRTKRSK